ncbi:ABC transporter permease [Bifidobacterium sp. 64T4]|uniref:ABC transporter permease n=1 Tax=Bifidobacterium pongonis TaxID=2834432 RepID=UPI001C5881E5|nr:ABC transporter permease [Bifidobacterium pongonis]MBW3094801.1 ABC transporter permease [Bifidobacterium pongonis]
MMLFSDVGAGGAIYCMLLPCIAALAGGGLYSDEKNSGRLRMMLTRTGRRDVLRSSFCAGFVLGGLGGVLPLLLNLVIAVIRQPHMSFIDGVDHIATNPYFTYYPVIRADSWLYPLYETSQPLMLVVVFALIFMLSGAYACLAIGASAFIGKRYVEILVPFAVSLLIWLLPAILPLRAQLVANEFSQVVFLNFSADSGSYGVWGAGANVMLFLILAGALYEIELRRDAL